MLYNKIIPKKALQAFNTCTLFCYNVETKFQNTLVIFSLKKIIEIIFHFAFLDLHSDQSNLMCVGADYIVTYDLTRFSPRSSHLADSLETFNNSSLEHASMHMTYNLLLRKNNKGVI